MKNGDDSLAISGALVTITVPIYNTKKEMLEDCIYSILNQTYQNIELVLVDDGSDKDYADYLDTFLLKDHRIRIVHQDNKGPSSARNAGLKMARGEYICFVDSDDMIEPTMIEKGIREANVSNADIIGWTYKRLCGGKKFACKYIGPDVLSFEGEEINDYLCLSLCSRALKDIYFPYCVCLWGKMFRMRLFRDNPEIRLRTDMRFAEDQDIVQRLFPKANHIVIKHEDLYIYRLNTESLTKKMREDFIEEQLKAFDYLSEDIDFSNPQLKEAFDNYRVGFLVNYGTHYLWHPNSKLGYCEKRTLLVQATREKHFSETLRKAKRRYFTNGQYFYLLCLRLKMYDIALLAAWYGSRSQ